MTALWHAREAAIATGGALHGAAWQANGVSIDTRTLQKGDLFIALSDKRDGHDFAQAALDAGAGQVVGFDFDFGALEQAFARFSASDAPVLPLWLDATNPSPAQGWDSAERMSFGERAKADAMVALDDESLVEIALVARGQLAVPHRQKAHPAKRKTVTIHGNGQAGRFG